MPAPVFELAIVDGRASVEQLTEQLNAAFQALWLQGESVNSITAANYDPLTGILTLTFSDETTFSTGDLRGDEYDDSGLVAQIAEQRAQIEALQQAIEEILAGGGGPTLSAPQFTTPPSLLGSTALNGTVTISLGVASGVPTPELTGTLTRPGAQPFAVTDGQQITITEDDLGGDLVLAALASNSEGDDPETVTLQIPAVAPSPFAADDWTLATGLEANQLVVSINSLPSDGGSSITAIEYTDDGGTTWTALSGAGTGARTLTMDESGTSYSMSLRAVNAVDNGTPSDTKTATSGAVADTSAQRVILLTDYAGDCDDAAAMAIAARAHEQGDINLLGVVVTSTVATSAPGARGNLDAYGLESVPVYAYQGSVGTYNDRYSIQMRDEFGVPGQTRTAYQDDVTGLRTLLAAAPNGSVKLIDVGAPISTARLLASPADGISPLTGAELIAAKVAGLWAMAGNFPTGVSEYNMNRDVASSQAVYANWPTPIYAHGGEVGATIFTGPAPGTIYGHDPVRTAFDAFQNVYGGILQNGRRQSWDPATVHHAIYGNQALYSLSAPGTIAIDGAGVSTWTAGGGNRQYVIKTATDAEIAASMQALIDDYAIIVPSPSAAVDAAILALSPLFLLSAPDGGTIPDATGNGRNAAIVGTPGNTIGTGPLGMPFFESDADSYAVLAHDELYNSAARTMCFWYNTTPSFQSTCGLYRGAAERMVVLAPGTTSGAEWNGSSNSLSVADAFNAQGQWTFVAMTVGAGGSFLYTSQGMIRGALRVVASNAVTTGVTTSLRLALGARATSASAFDRIGRGGYAKISRWDRALSQEEIQSIYDASIIA